MKISKGGFFMLDIALDVISIVLNLAVIILLVKRRK